MCAGPYSPVNTAEHGSFVEQGLHPFLDLVTLWETHV